MAGRRLVMINNMTGTVHGLLCTIDSIKQCHVRQAWEETYQGVVSMYDATSLLALAWVRDTTSYRVARKLEWGWELRIRSIGK